MVCAIGAQSAFGVETSGCVILEYESKKLFKIRIEKML